MKAVLIGEDKKLYWGEAQDPIVKSGDVLLEIHAAALNRADLLQREGT